MSGNRQPDILCQEHIYRRLTDGRHRPPVFTFGTDRLFASNT
ncbi:hypothetical protein HMPREF2531_04594 [Bacteroides intestinalis]|uniref:Uncharacterized protein n=1 Tax=Bacteroides intestinalis TaxID=329854 RepID=A0A139KU80_9BACE|nr:hypothetical protein HMPREF2531_04594 [Bacteroides intestinalis]